MNEDQWNDILLFMEDTREFMKKVEWYMGKLSLPEKESTIERNIDPGELDHE